ncbi:MAG: GGDEF domain-containing protein [Rhizobium sp.]|nr:GGDEF domain-containing protein [Rhizobium sp.]
MRLQNLTSLVCAAVLAMAPGLGMATERFQTLLEKAEDVRSTDPATFERALGELNTFVGEADERQRQHLRYLKAYQLAYGGRYDLAIAEAEVLLRESDDVVIRLRAGALAANSAAATRDFIRGLRHMDEALALIDQVQDRDLRHNVLLVAAILVNQIGQYELGRDYSEQILSDQPDHRNRCYASHLRLESRLNLDTLDDPDEAILASAADCEAHGEVVGANLIRLHLARHWAKQDRSSSALGLLQQYLPQVKEARYPRLLAEFHSLLAERNLSLGALDAARRHAELAVESSAGIAQSMPLIVAEHVLFKVAMARGDTEAALVHHMRYAQADKAYLDEVKARELAFQLARHETSRKVQDIELLRRQNQVLQLEQEVAAQATRNTQLVVLLLAGLLGTIALWAWRTKKAQLLFRRLAETDALTGISNRMHFSRRAEEALEYCRKDGEDAGLVMFDLDEFKAINDRFGHAVGDWVLRQVADTCSAVCRKHDRFGRLGGEEFAFLLVGCDLGSSIALAQECRKRIAAIDTAPSGHVFRITASFGVAGTRNCGYDFLTLLSRADDALYRSKREGRDRVHVHGLEAVPGALPTA